MPVPGDHVRRARRAWSAGDWDAFSRHLLPVGQLMLDRLGVEAGQELLDVGTGSGGTIAVPAARRGARVVGCDVTPELLHVARRRAADAGVEVAWVEADAQDLPFADGRFDRVTSTFGAMFAPDHARTAAELVRVCRPGGRIGMTTWRDDGFAGELFAVTGAFAPPLPAGVGAPRRWGDEEHARAVFAAAGADARITTERVDLRFPSDEAAVAEYTTDFGPLLGLRAIIEPQGRWPEFLDAFAGLVARFSTAAEAGIAIGADYLLITAER